MYNLVAKVPHKTPTRYKKSLADIFSTKYYIMTGICNVNNFQMFLIGDLDHMVHRQHPQEQKLMHLQNMKSILNTFFTSQLF